MLSMKKIVVLVVCLVLSVALRAQSADEKAVSTAVEKLKKAMIDADKATLQTLAAPELSYGHSSGKIEDKEAFVKALTSGESDFVTIELSDQSIKIAGNTALVRHTLTAQTNNNGQPGNAKLGVLLVWQKQQGQWKLLARQAFKL